METSSLRVGDQTFEPETAELEIVMKTERWDVASQSWLYDIESAYAIFSIVLHVNERSGEDGAIAPFAQTVGIEPDETGHYPLPSDLVSRKFDDEESDWDAWLGNDAPELLDNRLSVLAWNDGRLRVEWRAESEGGDELCFQGDFDVTPIRLRVKKPGDADRVIENVFGPKALSRLEKSEGKWVDYGEGLGEDRRRWFTVSYWVQTPQ